MRRECAIVYERAMKVGRVVGSCELGLLLALVGCASDGGGEATDEWTTGTGADGTTSAAPASTAGDDGGDEVDDPELDTGDDEPAGTTGSDDTGPAGTDDGADSSEWCVYEVVASGEIMHLNVHAEPDPTSTIHYTLEVGETVWGGSTVVNGFRDLDRQEQMPQWAEATRLENTGECVDDDDPPPAEVPLPQGFQLPFECGQVWRLDTWGHAPALDMVREPDQVGTEGATLRAPAPGVVNQSYYHDNAGNLVQIDHGDGWYTTYIHMQSRAVEVGDVLQRGDTIGAVGATGPTSNGHPHLHFEVGMDADGDGQATWGFEGAERVAPWFDGVEYGQEDALTWRDVASNNCP